MSAAANTTAPLLPPQYPIDFSAITPERLEASVRAHLAQAKEELEQIANTKANTWGDILGALEGVTEALEYSYGLVGHLDAVVSSPELRAVYQALQPEVSAFFSSISLHPALWKTIRRYAETPHARTLDPIRARLLKKTMDDFRRQGADLDDEAKAKLQAIDVELAKVTQLFTNHVLDATNAVSWLIEDEARLSGLPASARTAAREDAQRRDLAGWRFSLQAPSYTAVLTYADDRELRREIWQAYQQRASTGEFDNRPLIADILRLRREKALLLGYRDFADYVLHPRMATSGAKAREFVDQLASVSRAPFERETAELTSFAKNDAEFPIDKLEPWDAGYYAERQRKALYDFDDEALRPYFVREKVFAGLFELVSRLYGVTIVQATDASVWHENVTAYEVRDADQELGMFYCDFSPRDSKRAGAWMNPMIGGTFNSRYVGLHVATICGSLSDATADAPSLLTHYEVETVFHEFGHLMHHMLSEVPLRSLSGTNVAWDFVELPSQIMENWCWEREALDLFASHYQTGAKIPQELFEKMVRARNFRSASFQMRQLSFADVDLALHMDYQPEKDGDVVAYARARMQPFTAVELPENYAMICGFSHLFSSPVAYAAGYYSYKWAEVLDADAFTQFASHGIFSREVGQRFRQTILSRGDSQEPAVLYRNFMGRDPDSGALLRRLGLATDAK